MATEPLLAILMLKQLGFEPWQYGLAFALPCIGALFGARLAPRITTQLGEYRVMRIFGALRVCWPVGLAFIWSGMGGLIFVMILQFCLMICISIYSPVFATYRLKHTENEFVVRVLSTWTLVNGLVTATLIVLWGVLASLTDLRIAIGAAGFLLLFTPLLLPRRRHMTN